MIKWFTDEQIYDFVKESNAIERIFREPLEEEIAELERFLMLEHVTLDDLITFVSVYQPDAVLRTKPTQNVRVGSYLAPRGGPDIALSVEKLLSESINAWKMHIDYEKVHPFTDGNGRSGRALWAWKRRKEAAKGLAGGFLLNFYYETLANVAVYWR